MHSSALFPSSVGINWTVAPRFRDTNAAFHALNLQWTLLLFRQHSVGEPRAHERATYLSDQHVVTEVACSTERLAKVLNIETASFLVRNQARCEWVCATVERKLDVDAGSHYRCLATPKLVPRMGITITHLVCIFPGQTLST